MERELWVEAFLRRGSTGKRQLKEGTVLGRSSSREGQCGEGESSR